MYITLDIQRIAWALFVVFFIVPLVLKMIVYLIDELVSFFNDKDKVSRFTNDVKVLFKNISYLVGAILLLSGLFYLIGRFG